MPGLIVRIREASDIALLVVHGRAVDPTILRAGRRESAWLSWRRGPESTHAPCESIFVGLVPVTEIRSSRRRKVARD